MDDKIYAEVYANFSVKADKEAEKFTWDFGDEHKSYLKDTKHKYEKEGKYDASLKITGEKCEDKFYEFTVKVEEYDAPKVRIKSINPNPEGNDTDNEWIELENQSKKKVNLIGWSVATGWDKLSNHPIREKFEIKAGKTKKLTRDICAFTLNNTKTKIELRDPSGKVADKIKYDRKKKKIEEDEIYEENDDDWEWHETQTDADLTQTNTENEQKVSSPLEREVEDERIDSDMQEKTISPDLIGKYSIDPRWQTKQENKIKLAGFSSKIKFQKNLDTAVLGASTIKNAGEFYSFTRPVHQKHWAIKLAEELWLKINYLLNIIIFKVF